MKHYISIFSVLAVILLSQYGCDSKSDTVTKGREAVKEVVTQPFNALNTAKDSLRQSEDKQKAALEDADKEIK